MIFALIKKKIFSSERFPVSENLFNYGFYIPCGIGLKNEELSQVARVVKKIFKYTIKDLVLLNHHLFE